jgi:2-methylcitrate dehydratase PrpD
VKRLHAGIGIRGGIQAAYLSREGLTGPPTALEGAQGFCRAFADESKMEELTKPSDHYEIMEVGIKRYPTVATSLTPVDAMKELVRAHNFSHEDIETIEVAVAARAVEHGGLIYEPTDVSSAQFSIPYSVALQAVVGSNDLAHYMDKSLWKDDRITNIIRRIRLISAPDATGDARHSCRMSIVLKNGRKHETYIPHPRGSFLDPLPADEIKEKFELLTERVVGGSRVDKIIGAVDDLESMSDVTDLADLLCMH